MTEILDSNGTPITVGARVIDEDGASGTECRSRRASVWMNSDLNASAIARLVAAFATTNKGEDSP